MVPRVALVEFESIALVKVFLKNYDQHPPLASCCATKSIPFEDRLKHRALFKIKRAICEIVKCDGASVLIDKPSRRVYRALPNGSLEEIAQAPSDASISWNSRVEKPIRDRTLELLSYE